MTDMYPIQIHNETDINNELSINDGLLAINHLRDIGLDGLLEDCNYPFPMIRPIFDCIKVVDCDNLATLEHSPYTGQFKKYADISAGHECQLHIIPVSKEIGGGYHFAALNRCQPLDAPLFDDDEVVFETLLLRQTEKTIQPYDVFVRLMHTRCGHTAWENAFLTFFNENIGACKTTADWENKQAQFIYKYPVKRPDINPFINYEMWIRNFGIHTLNGNRYNLFIRMAKRSKQTAPQTSKSPSWKDFIRFNLGESFNGQYVH